MKTNQRVKELFLNMKITQKQFAVLLGIKNRSQISNWLGMSEPFPDKHLLTLVRSLDYINARWLITGKGTMLEIEEKVRKSDSTPQEKQGDFCLNCIKQDTKINLLLELLEKKDDQITELKIEIARINQNKK